MNRYDKELIRQVQDLRAMGKTYGEIRSEIGMMIPKGTLSGWCSDVVLPAHYQARIEEFKILNIGKAKAKAVAMNKIKKEEFFEKLKVINTPVAERIFEPDMAKVTLAMLCLGEASKSKSASFYLGNSDPRIITLFLELLKCCFDFQIEKVRCTVQCRADQDIPVLEDYWQKVTNIPVKYFYKARIDPRTIGKPTLKEGYKGVLKVDYFDRKVQLELESLADLVYNRVLQGP